MNGSVIGSESDDKGQCTCHHLETNFPAVGTLGTFLTNMWVLAVFCAKKQTSISMTTPYFKPVKKLLAEYILNCSPTNGFTWLNRYLEKIRSKIFSMDNLICTFVTPEGHSRHGLHIGSMLDSMFKFGGKDERYNFITCGQAVIAALKLLVLQPWSSTSMSHLVSIGFGFGVRAVEIIFTVLPPVNTTPSMI